MPVPVNNPATPGGTLLLDQRVVSATIASFLKDADEFASDFSSDFVAPINGQRTSTVLVRRRLELQTAATPASRDGLLARTGVGAPGSVEVGLTGDEYLKVAVDTLGVDPATHSREIGEAAGRTITRVSNRSVIDAVQGLTNTVAVAGTADAQGVWSALLEASTGLVEAEIDTTTVIAYVSAGTWATLLGGVGVLSGTGDPRARAAELLSLGRVRVVPFTDGATRAAILHPSTLACARVLSGVRQTQEDFDQIVEARIRYGTAVIDQAAAVRIAAGA